MFAYSLEKSLVCRNLMLATCLVLVAGCNEVNTAAPIAEAPVSTPPITIPPVTTPPTTTPPTTPPPATDPPATPTVTPATSLPTVSALNNVHVAVNGGSATITFDTVDDAADYRVFALAANDQIQVVSDGSVIIPNAVYRCAGTYQVPATQQENETLQSNGISSRVASVVNGYTRKLSEATMGYVYTTPSAAADLVPVYVVGNPDVGADDDAFYRFQASRDKKYTTSYAEYSQLVATGWRDDGIAFYVPAHAGAGTKPILTNTSFDGPVYSARYYLNEGAELTSRSANLTFATAFNVLANPASGARPLMRVFYQVAQRNHDELAVGMAGFNRIRYQGLNNPAPVLHYSGITATTTLVVEALDKGCPHQGTVSSQTLAAATLDGIAYDKWYSIADLQKTVSDGEVYINGQFDGVTGRPKAIARAFVNVSPQAREQMDWMSTPESFSENFTPTSCGDPNSCWGQFRVQSNTYDVSFQSTVTDHWKVGNALGEFLVNYADIGADTPGKFRLSVRSKKATITANSFVHAVMEVNSVGSGRRYPQLILSDQDVPIQNTMINGHSLVLQTFGDFPSRIDIEICDHMVWDVNNQCPRFILRHRFNSAGTVTGINPIPEQDQFMSAMDAPTKFDLYASSSRAYVFVNDKPYACANLTGYSGVSPAPVPPTGAVTVTFGDALYHSGVDTNFTEKMQGSFIHRHQLTETSRHYDNLGFSSGVSAPAWDETRQPCSSVMTTLGYDPNP